MRTHWLMPALCAASVLLASGCGGDSNGPSDGGGGNPPPDGDVLVKNNFYDPATLSVTTGTTVTWAWIGGSHSVTFSNDDSDIKSSGTFQRSFASTGTFPYHCRVHAEMTGSITVTAAGSAGGNPPAGGGGGGMGGGGYDY